jgi:predicted nicotinamide N-methyase
MSPAFPREIVAYPGLVRGKAVLEIGAGCGLNGLVALQVGASEVVLTDVEGPVLLNLAACVAMNTPSSTEAKESVVPDAKLNAKVNGNDVWDGMYGTVCMERCIILR